MRYDGDHQHTPLITQILSQHFCFHSFCPEVFIGLGVPRPPIQLIATSNGIRCQGVEPPHNDVTAKLARAGKQPWMKNLSGYIVKSRSPSCGNGTVKVHHEQHIDTDGIGVFTQQLQLHYPNIPIIEETALEDPRARQDFIRQVMQYHST
ncbi:hypothetical protein A9Q99_07330 [Gammaproteobacteria bacterium 45_16_T64]|nr:hypothetical protein A9Q99_07330 [Gammaproteobacteria bacterium 45_16_T64]